MSSRPVKNAESWDHLVAQINRLPEPQKTAMSLRYVQDCNDAEIAQIMGLDAAQVELTFRQACDLLRPALRRANDWHDDDPPTAHPNGSPS